MKYILSLSLALVLSLFISTNVFADHDGTSASSETHTSTSATGGTSGSTSGSTQTSSATGVTVTGVPVKMEVEIETEHGVQTITVKPDDSSSNPTCGGKEMPKLACPSGYSVSCNAASQWACVKSAASTDVRSGVSTGAGAAAGAATVDVRDEDDDGDMIDTILEDSQVKSAVFIKIEGVKGESNDDKKMEGGKEGRVVLESEFKNGDIPEEDDFEILIDSVLVQGWDPKKKEEVKAAAPQNSEDVDSEEELALFVLAHSSDDTKMESISLNFTKIEFKYRSDAKLFGIIPSSLAQDVSLQDGVVSLKNPWYSFLFTGALNLEDIETAAKKKDKPKPIQIESWSFGASNAGSMAQGSGGGAGKVNVAVGDVNGDGRADSALSDLAADFSALSEVMKATYDLKMAKK